MSIHQINKLFQNKGCNIAVSLVLGVAVISMLGWGSRGCGSDRETNPELERQLSTIAEIGGFRVTRQMVDAAVEQQMQQYAGIDLPSSFKTRIQASAMMRFLTNGLALKLAKEKGIDFSDDDIRRQQIQGATEQLRQNLIRKQKLAPNATEQEFEAAYKAMTGKSLAEERKKAEQQITELLKNPDEKEGLKGDLAFAALVDKEKSRFPAKEEDVKNSFVKYRLKVIDVDPKKAGKDGALAKAKSILAEIKGGLSFEAAMDKYSSRPAAKGKKVSDEIMDYTQSMMEGNAAMKPLLGLKVGETSDAIAGFAGAASIYKLVDKKVDLPKDYDKQKAKLLDDRSRSDAAKSITDEINKLDKPEIVKWTNEGFHVLHDFAKLQNPTPGSDRSKQLSDIVNRALKAQDSPQDADIAAATAMIALPELEATLPPKEALPLKAKVLAAYVQHSPEVDVVIQLTETYIALGDADNTAAKLRQAADMNSVRVDEAGRANWTIIQKDQKTALAKKLITQDDVAFLDKAYKDWQAQYAEQKKAAAELEAERKKTEEELKKAGQTATPPTGKPAPPPGPNKPSGKP